MIEFKNIFKSFDDKTVLENFSLKIAPGERVCIMGPSGGGKTTLGNLLLGTISPDFGEVICDSGAISPVFQEDRLCEDFSALSNLRMVLPDRNAQKARDILMRLLNPEDINKPVKTFSGGMKRRVAIGRALCYDKPILLLDEPFSGLDSYTKQSVADVINEYSKDKTVILISHDKKEAEMLGAKIIELN